MVDYEDVSTIDKQIAAASSGISIVVILALLSMQQPLDIPLTVALFLAAINIPFAVFALLLLSMYGHDFIASEKSLATFHDRACEISGCFAVVLVFVIICHLSKIAGVVFLVLALCLAAYGFKQVQKFAKFREERRKQ